jgi:hypothetical protein
MLPRKMQALKPSIRFEGRPCQEGEPLAGMGPPFLLADLSLFFPSHCVILTVISKIHCKSRGTTSIILPGTP